MLTGLAALVVAAVFTGGAIMIVRSCLGALATIMFVWAVVATPPR